MVESRPSKPLVAGSSPVSRSKKLSLVNTGQRAGRADVAQLVEHVLGKDGVSGSIPLIGSRDTL